LESGAYFLDIENNFQYGTGSGLYAFTGLMKLLRATKNAIVSVASLFLIAGGVAYPVVCGMESCCCMPEITDDLALQQGHCGCGCGQIEQSRVPDESAVTIGLSEIKPVETNYDYIIETDNTLFEDLDFNYSFQEKTSHSPPLLLDNRYTPLLC
jgi:hypothetical protein